MNPDFPKLVVLSLLFISACSQRSAVQPASTEPVVPNRVVYLAVGNHDTRDGPRPPSAIKAGTGEELWRFGPDARLLTQPAIGNQILFLISFPGTVYALH